jgi:hypothetical protein
MTRIQIKVLTSIGLLLLLSFTACKQTDERPFPQEPLHRDISIKVAIIYNFGGPQAVASEHFHLLTKDFVQIWKQSGLVNEDKLKDLKLNDEQLFRLVFIGDQLTVLNNKPSKLDEALKPYIVKKVKTDFEGNATFENVPDGNYYIYGITETRSGYAVWNYAVSTNESRPVLLDNKNAIYSWSN